MIAAPKFHLFYFFFLGSLCFVSFGLVFVVFIFIIIYYYYYLLLVVVAVVIMVVRLVFCFPLVSSDVCLEPKNHKKKMVFCVQWLLVLLLCCPVVYDE